MATEQELLIQDIKIQLSVIHTEQGIIQKQINLLDESMEIANAKVNDVHAFIFGVEKRGGLATAVEIIQKDVSNLKTWKIQVATAGAFVAALFGVLGGKLSQLFLGK